MLDLTSLTLAVSYGALCGTVVYLAGGLVSALDDRNDLRGRVTR